MKLLDHCTFVGSQFLSVLCELKMRSLICVNALQKQSVLFHTLNFFYKKLLVYFNSLCLGNTDVYFQDGDYLVKKKIACLKLKLHLASY